MMARLLILGKPAASVRRFRFEIAALRGKVAANPTGTSLREHHPMTRFSWTAIAVFVMALITGSLIYDSAIQQWSATRETFKATHTKCGPVTNSGPKENPGVRNIKTFRLMARRDDGRLVTVERLSRELPDCGATLTIAERVTPWGTVWYWTEQ
jgi:hypothetical protein